MKKNYWAIAGKTAEYLLNLFKEVAANTDKSAYVNQIPFLLHSGIYIELSFFFSLSRYVVTLAQMGNQRENSYLNFRL